MMMSYKVYTILYSDPFFVFKWTAKVKKSAEYISDLHTEYSYSYTMYITVTNSQIRYFVTRNVSTILPCKAYF